MRKVKKNFGKPPAALGSADVKKAMTELLTSGNKEVIVSDLYRGKVVQADGKVKYKVVESLMKIYADKCGYCETKEFDPQVEHYRPKGKITGVSKHPGYYWLAFEWSNLVSTCFDCNKIGNGKGNHFPISGGDAARLTGPPKKPDNSLDASQTKADKPPLSLEKPMLLHPEIDTTETCFAFDKNGGIKGVDVEGRGSATIKICNLNRKNLKYRRQKALDFFVMPIKDAFWAFGDAEHSKELVTLLNFTFKRIHAWGNPDQEYSLYGLYTFENFEKVIAPLLPLSIRPITLQLFDQYKLSLK